MITNGSLRRGTVEQAVDFMVFMSGPLYQGRVAVDRGHLPVFRAVLDAPEMLAAPPLILEQLALRADSPNKIHRMFMIPALEEFWLTIEQEIERAHTGDAPAEDAMKAAEDRVRIVLSEQRPDYNALREKFGLAPV